MIGILFPTFWEAKIFLQQQRLRVHKNASTLFNIDRNPCIIKICGIGGDNAVAGAQALHNAGAEKIWLCGFGGALVENFEVGDIVLDANGLGLKIQQHLQQKNVVCSLAKIAQSSVVLSTREDKMAFAQEHSALVVDMESEAVRRFCTEHQIQFVCLRVISDELSDLLPHTLRNFGANSKLTASFIVRVLTSPRDWPRYWKLNYNSKRAAQRLAQVLDILIHSEEL